MPLEVSEGEARGLEPRFGRKALVAVLVLYLAATIAATWPFVTTLGTRLPSDLDPVQHLWLMRWYQSCLLEGRSPWVCPDIQYPSGAPIALFSPLHLETLLFLPTSLATGNDILAYNLVWLGGFLLTGLGTCALAWSLLRHRASAFMAGLLAMLGGPMMMHSHAHLELIQAGSLPLFLLAWIRLIDRPSRGRLAAAVASYVLVAMSAAYYMVFAIVPAVSYVVWAAWRDGRRQGRSWSRSRARWLLGFTAACLPILLLLFSGHLVASLEGMPMGRTREEFDAFVVPWWGYLVPISGTLLARWLPSDPYVLSGIPGEGMAYLGATTIALLLCAAMPRSRFRDRGFWWLMLAILVALSMGSTLTIGGARISLPVSWLYELFPPIRWLRAPARFKFLALIVAAILAGAGLRQLLSRPWPAWVRGGLLTALVLFAVADQAQVPFESAALRPMPACYAWALAQDPEATFLEVPQVGSGSAVRMTTMAAYWQSYHGGRTNAGYSGHDNVAQDQRLGFNSPFLSPLLANPAYPESPDSMSFDVTANVAFRDYAWLYMRVHGFRYLVVHRWPGASFPETPPHLERLEALLADAKVFEDEDTLLYDRERLPRPSRAVPLCVRGWKQRRMFDEQFVCETAPVAEIAVYNPEPDHPMRLGINVRPRRRPRVVTLRHGATELARWRLGPEAFMLQVSPPFQLPEGLSTLTLVCDDAEPDDLAFRPSDQRDRADLLVSGLTIVPQAETPAVAAGEAPPENHASQSPPEPRTASRPSGASLD